MAWWWYHKQFWNVCYYFICWVCDFFFFFTHHSERTQIWLAFSPWKLRVLYFFWRGRLSFIIHFLIHILLLCIFYLGQRLWEMVSLYKKTIISFCPASKQTHFSKGKSRAAHFDGWILLYFSLEWVGWKYKEKCKWRPKAFFIHLTRLFAWWWMIELCLKWS